MTARPTRVERVAAAKDRIRQVAGAQFARHGFVATGVRQIAEGAGVDPALVIRHFGSKEALFLETMVLPDRWSEVLAGPLETLAEDYMRFLLDQEEHREGAAVLAALVRSSERPEVARAVRSATQTVFEEGILPRVDGPDAALRVHLFAAGVTGLQVALWVSVDEVLAAASADQIVDLYAPALQRLLTPDPSGVEGRRQKRQRC